jgi:hypothetical protein
MFFIAYSPSFDDPYKVFYYDGHQVLFEKDHYDWYVTIAEALEAVSNSTAEDFTCVGAYSHYDTALLGLPTLPTYEELISSHPELLI